MSEGMAKRIVRGSPFSKMLSPKEAFAEVEHKCTLYELDGILLGACQILYRHMDVYKLNDLQKMEIAAAVRPAISEVEHHIEWQKRQKEQRRLPQ